MKKKDRGEIFGGILLIAVVATALFLMWRYGTVKTAQFHEAQYRWELNWADRIPR